MPAPLLRSLVFLIPALSALGLGLVAQGRQFGWIEGEHAGERLQVSGAPLAVREGDLIRVRYGNGDTNVTVVFPSNVAAADSVQVVLELVDARGRHTGPARLDVQETGQYFGGRLQAELEGEPFFGGLRVAPREAEAIADRSSVAGVVAVQ